MYLASSYDPAQRSNQGAWLRDRYKQRFDQSAPVVKHHAAALYDGILLHVDLVRQKQSFEAADLQRVSEELVSGMTLGTCAMRANHLSTTAYIVQTDGNALRSVEDVGQNIPAPPEVQV